MDEMLRLLKQYKEEYLEIINKSPKYLDKDYRDTIKRFSDYVESCKSLNSDNDEMRNEIRSCKQLLSEYNKYSTAYNAVRTKVSSLLDTYSRSEYNVMVNWRFLKNVELNLEKTKLSKSSPEIKLNLKDKDTKKAIVNLITKNIINTNIGGLEMSAIVGSIDERCTAHYNKVNNPIVTIKYLPIAKRIEAYKDYIEKSNDFKSYSDFFYMDKASGIVRFLTPAGIEARKLFLSLCGTEYNFMLNKDKYLYKVPNGIDNDNEIIEGMRVGKISLNESNYIHVVIDYNEELYKKLLDYFSETYIRYAIKCNEKFQKVSRTVAVPNKLEKDLESLYVNKSRNYTPLLVLSNNIVNPFLIIPNLTWDLILDENNIVRNGIRMTSNVPLDDFPEHYKTKIDFELLSNGCLQWDLNSKGNRKYYPNIEGTVFIQTKLMCKCTNMKYIKPNWNFILSILSKEFKQSETSYKLKKESKELIKILKEFLLKEYSKELEEYGINKDNLLTNSYDNKEDYNKLIDFLENFPSLSSYTNDVLNSYVEDSSRNILVESLTNRYFLENNLEYFGNINRLDFIKSVNNLLDSNRYKDYN